MITFIAKNRHPVLVMRPHKNDKEGNVLQEPVYVKFEDKIFKTDDENIINFIRSLKNFNADYYELKENAELPKDAGYQGNNIGIQRMDSPVAAQNTQVEALSVQVQNLTNIIAEMLKEQQVSKASNPVDADNETKIDKRSREYKQSQKSTLEIQE